MEGLARQMHELTLATL